MNLESSRPLYLQVEAAVQNDIREKKYLPGEKLPTEEELCEIYGVSKITIRKAFDLLTENGFVERIRGKGTFVKPEKEKLSLSSTHGFSGALSNRGHKTTYSVLRSQILTANKQLAEKLQLRLGEKIYNIQRLMWEDSTPIGIDDFYASAKKYPTLFEKGSQVTSLYQLLEEDYGVKSGDSLIEINGISATAEQANLLQCLTGDPLFVIEKIGYDQKENPFHFSISTIRCDLITYVIQVSDHITLETKDRINPIQII